ncbi:MAG: P1 family peptidase, partial [Bryobacteraceae bacterium]
MKGLTDIPGVRVGHVSDYEAITGCTVIIFDPGAVAGVDIRGFATGTQEIDVLNPLHVTP